MAQVYLSGPLKGQPIQQNLKWIPSAGGVPALTPAVGLPPQVPAPMSGLTTRKVPLVQIDPTTGNPILPSKQPFLYPADSRTNPALQAQAGMYGRGLPANYSTALLAALNRNDVVKNVPAPQVAAPRQASIDATNPIDLYQQFGIMPSRQPSSAERAIAGITVRGGTPQQALPGMMGRGQPTQVASLVPLPRERPLPPAAIPLTAALKAPPSVPAPRNVGPSYTIKSGDTLTALAKKFGTTVGALANANGISNPNKIKAGATLNLAYLAPPVPRPSSNVIRTASDKRAAQQADYARRGLNEFGMIE